VTEHEVLRRRVDRQDLQRLRDEQLGVAEGVPLRIEDVAVPEAAERRQVTAQGAQDVVRVPAQDPAVEQRIAEILRDALASTAESGHVITTVRMEYQTRARPAPAGRWRPSRAAGPVLGSVRSPNAPPAWQA